MASSSKLDDLSGLHIDGLGKGDPLGTAYSDNSRPSRCTISGTVPQQQGDSRSISRLDAVLTQGSSGNTWFTIELARAGDVPGSTSVEYHVFGSGLNPANDAEFFGRVPPSGTLIFGFGETSRTITVALNGRGQAETDKESTVSLSNSSGPTKLLNDTASGIVASDDFARITVHPISRRMKAWRRRPITTRVHVRGAAARSHGSRESTTRQQRLSDFPPLTTLDVAHFYNPTRKRGKNHVDGTLAYAF